MLSENCSFFFGQLSEHIFGGGYRLYILLYSNADLTHCFFPATKSFDVVDSIQGIVSYYSGYIFVPFYSLVI